MGERAADELRYRAFLSYSHKDAAAAGRLHRRLETYRMPKRLVATETAHGVVPQRLWPIFRDREELPAATDLSETVREALAQSGALIILCSPHAAGSLWVAEEIETFRALHPDRPILAAILDGDPPDCFPAALRAFGQDGTWHEPLATDLRPHCDGPRLGLLKLVAGITGVGLDALVQRDASRRVRRVMTVTAVAVIAMLIMAALAALALNARAETERQRAQAKGLADFMLNDLRERLRGVGRLDVMAAVNERALAFYDEQLRSYNLSADALMRARTLHAIGEDTLRRGDENLALATFRNAHRATSALLQRSPNDTDTIFAHAQSEYWIGYVDYRRGNRSAARQRWQQYKRLADHLLAIDGNNARWVREAGYADGNLCTLALVAPVDATLGLNACSAALNEMERVRDLEGNSQSVIKDLANRHGWLVIALNANGRWREAQAHQQEHENLVRHLIEADPNNLEYQEIWMMGQFGFGEMLVTHGERHRALTYFRRAAVTATLLRQRDPQNASWRSWQQRITRSMN